MLKKTILLSFIGIIYFISFFLIDRWKTNLHVCGDDLGYYLHVVALFVHQDVGDYDKSLSTLKQTNPKAIDPREDIYGIRLTPKGKRYIKYTVGAGIMETPFFALAHLFAKVNKKYKANGWTKPYSLLVGLAPMCYVLLGFHFLMLALGRFYEEKIIFATIIALALATNLFFHSTYYVMAHGFLFFDYCLLIYLSILFYDRPTRSKALGIGLMVGLITITRVPEVISVLIPFLWGIDSFEKLKERFFFFFKNYQYLLLAALGFFAFFSIQVSYWYFVSDQFFFNPYKGEGFDFSNPQIYKGFFHFKNGWLIYTPIMALSLIGIFFTKRYSAAAFWAIISFVSLHCFIHYSYYAWTFFPGIGQRPMVETYALLAFSLAAFFTACNYKSWLKWIPYTSIFLFGILNLFQTWQMQQGIILPDSGSQAFYLESFGMIHPTRNSLRAFDSKVSQPNVEQLSLIKEIFHDSFEDTSKYKLSTEFQSEGLFSLPLPQEKGVTPITEFEVGNLESGNWLKFEIKAFFTGKEKIWDRYKCADLNVQLVDENGHNKKWMAIKMSTHIGNKGNSIWWPGQENQWEEASFFYQIPKKIKPNWKFQFRIINNDNQKLFVDDFSIKLYKEE